MTTTPAPKGADIELASCPFCDNETVHVQDSYHAGNGFMVLCGNCTAEGPLCDTEQAAAEAWNRRGSSTSTNQGAAPGDALDAARLDYIERKGVRGGTYQGVTSIDVIVYAEDLPGGARHAIDKMIEREKGRSAIAASTTQQEKS